MEVVSNENVKEFIEVEDKTIVYNDNKYFIYEVGDCSENPEVNTIAIDGKTLGLKRDEAYKGKEIGYVVEATRLNENKFKCGTIWLQIEETGWAEAEIITNQEEIKFVQNILHQYGIELLQGANI